MEYKLFKNKIEIYSKEDFNPQHILECGQIFCYEKTEDGYLVFSKDKQATIVETQEGYEILCDDEKYFENFFDLQTDYSKIKKELIKFDILKKPIEFGSGIRILKNDIFEIIVSFIISANNNIKRIQKIIHTLKERCNQGRAFPSLNQLLNFTVDDFYKIGLGYRAPQLYKCLRQLDENEILAWQQMPTEQLRRKLISLSGVGPKVADCILLFGFGRKDVFPVDTWINKMYNMYYSPTNKREIIRNNLVNIFGNLSGYAQQYLFYYQRSGRGNN